MKLLRSLCIILMLCAPALAWNCTSPGQIRVQVPTGTVGNGTGDGPGQVVVDSGLTFECETPQTNPPSSTSNTNTNTNSNSNTNNNTNNVNNTLTNKVTNTLAQKQQQAQQQSQSQVATGGNATSTSNATGGNAASTSAATNNGNGSNNSTSNTVVEAPKIPVTSAYAPTSMPSAPCVKSFGGGVQTMAIGGSFGGGKIDQGCDERETARSFALLGSKLSACKVMIQGKQAKKAHITLEDCLGPKPEPVIPPPPPLPTVIYVPVPALPAVIPALPVVKTSITVYAPKKRKTIRHLSPDCQNVLQRICKEK